RLAPLGLLRLDLLLDEVLERLLSAGEHDVWLLHGVARPLALAIKPEAPVPQGPPQPPLLDRERRRTPLPVRVDPVELDVQLRLRPLLLFADGEPDDARVAPRLPRSGVL